LQRRLGELEQLRELRSHPEGKRMYEIHDRINTSSGDIEALSSLNADSVGSAAKSFVKGLLRK
jgi:hypothetical protein